MYFAESAFSFKLFPWSICLIYIHFEHSNAFDGQDVKESSLVFAFWGLL